MLFSMQCLTSTQYEIWRFSFCGSAKVNLVIWYRLEKNKSKKTQPMAFLSHMGGREKATLVLLFVWCFLVLKTNKQTTKTTTPKLKVSQF